MKYKKWMNQRVSKVEDADTLWVRELASHRCSEELRQFLQLEKQLNKHFKNKQPQCSQHFSLLKTGSLVVVCHQEFWVRGRVENMPVSKTEKIQVFLVDYGSSVQEEVMKIMPLDCEEWTSVPFQAKRVCLADVIPSSLQYSYAQEEVRLMLIKSKKWDPAATRFVKTLFKKLPKTEFEPVAVNKDGNLYGKLKVSLPEKSWVDLLPKVSAAIYTKSPENCVALDLAQILIDQGFAEPQGNTEKVRDGFLLQRHECYKLDTESNLEGSAGSDLSEIKHSVCGEEEMDITHSSEDSVSSSLIECQLSMIQIPSHFSQRLESSPGNTFMSRCKDTRSFEAFSAQLVKSNKVQMEALSDISSHDQKDVIHQYLQHSATRKLFRNTSIGENCPVPLKSPEYYFPHSISNTSSRSTSTSTSRSTGSSTCLRPTKTGSENGFYAKEGLSASSPQFTLNLPDKFMPHQRKYFTSTILQKPSCSSPYTDEEILATQNTMQEKMAMLNNENTAYHLISFEDAPVMDHTESEAASAKSFSKKKLKDFCLSLKGRQDSRNIHRDPQRSLELEEDFENSLHIETKPLEDVLTLERLGNSETIGEISFFKTQRNTINGENPSRKQMKESFINKEVDDSRMTPVMSYYGGEVNECVPALNEGLYSDVMQQYDDCEMPDISKLYRVFVAGERCISNEEVMINKDMMRAGLNSCIVNALHRKGLKATRLQAYTWPAIAKGSSTIIVGEKSCGKTMGYLVPLLSNMLDSWELISERLPPGIGPVLVVVCNTWRNAKCTADYIANLLPSTTSLKIVTAWGGCGGEEEVSTRKQLLSGCDILLTTAPFLLHLLMDSQGGPATTLKRCCHLVFDDAELILEDFSSTIKQILTTWGEERRKCYRPDLELQAVIVSSRWTELLGQLTEILLPLLEPSVIVSAPCEAAVATKVPSHMHIVANEAEALTQVLKLMNAFSIQKRSMVFVSNDDLAELFELMMNDAGKSYRVVDRTTQMWKVQEYIRQWHMMQDMTMIVSHGAEVSLLHHDLANAEVLFHTHLGSLWTTFTSRYSFMSANFVTDLTRKSPKCESHVILSKYTFEKLPGVLEELHRICGLPKETQTTAALIENGRSSKYTALCYYLKAYGRCCYRPVCMFRHEVQMFDIPQNIPRSGEVTFKVIKTLSAARYLVHLIQYRENPGTQCIDLSNSYHILHTALQNHFIDPANCEPLKSPETRMLCAIQDNGVWTRAQIISVNYKESTTMISAFLVDEGKEVTVSLKSILTLPSCLAVFPHLVVEVLLCRIQPVYQDQEWTLQASNFVYNIFVKRKDSRFIGRIVLALGSTLWLNPVAEFIKIDKSFVQKKALREKLILEKFGMDNPKHIEKLEKLCAESGISLEPEAVCGKVWGKTLTEALERLQAGRVREDACTYTSVNHEADSDGHSSEESHNIFELNRPVIESKTNVFSDTIQEQTLVPLQTTETESMKQEQILSETFNNTASRAVKTEAHQIINIPSSQKAGKASEHPCSTVENVKDENQKTSIYTESREGGVLSSPCSVPGADEKDKETNALMNNEKEYQECNEELLAIEGQQAEVSSFKHVGGSDSGLAKETLWSQSEDIVEVIIPVAGVEEYKCHLSSHLFFMGSIGKKHHILDENLAGDIDPDQSCITVQRNHVCITLRKAVRGKWRELFSPRECNQN